MFVLPPPPRYPAGNLGAPGGGPVETNNTLYTYSGPEYQLVAGEGTYVLRDEIQLAIPPPHPSENPVPNNNPLSTTTGLPTSGTKVSLTALAPRKPSSRSLFRLNTFSSTLSVLPHSIQEEAAQTPGGDTLSYFQSNAFSALPAFGGDNPALVPMNSKAKDASKKAKPKNNILKSNSSFVSRVIPHEALQKRIMEHSVDGVYAFVNINRAVQWLDLSSETKTENMSKILLTRAHALCHDVNEFSKSATHLDVIFGNSTADVVWYEPISQKYARLNKNGQINDSPISAIKWLPNSENFFITAHMDGTLVVYDKEKEDAPFVPEEPYFPDMGINVGLAAGRLQIRKSVQSRNQKTNPVACWRLSSQKINCIAFSPDGAYLAAVSEDGMLRIIDYLNEKLVAVYRSYYGGLTTVTWSPDGRYILTGGQDDLVSIWSFADGALVARCQGHNSWVTDVKFDPWRCDERNYRFGSVGEDCRLLLWDFSVGMLGRPRAHSIRPRGSFSSSVPGNRKDSQPTLAKYQSNHSLVEEGVTNGNDIVHEVDTRASTATLPAVMSKRIDDHPLSWLEFQDDCIMTACKEGHLRTWDRPKEGAGDEPLSDRASLPRSA